MINEYLNISPGTQIYTFAPYYENVQPKDNNALVWFDHACTYGRDFPHISYTDILVRSIYGLTPTKLQQKVSQLILVGFSVLYNILKV